MPGLVVLFVFFSHAHRYIVLHTLVTTCHRNGRCKNEKNKPGYNQAQFNGENQRYLFLERLAYFSVSVNADDKKGKPCSESCPNVKQSSAFRLTCRHTVLPTPLDVTKFTMRRHITNVQKLFFLIAWLRQITTKTRRFLTTATAV